MDPAGKSNSAFRESVASNFGPSQRGTFELGNGSGATLGSKKLRKDKDREQEEEMRKKFYNLRIQHRTDKTKYLLKTEERSAAWSIFLVFSKC